MKNIIKTLLLMSITLTFAVNAQADLREFFWSIHNPEPKKAITKLPWEEKIINLAQRANALTRSSKTEVAVSMIAYCERAELKTIQSKWLISEHHTQVDLNKIEWNRMLLNKVRGKKFIKIFLHSHPGPSFSPSSFQDVFASYGNSFYTTQNKYIKIAHEAFIGYTARGPKGIDRIIPKDIYLFEKDERRYVPYNMRDIQSQDRAKIMTNGVYLPSDDSEILDELCD